jgi:hypothetical protein
MTPVAPGSLPARVDAVLHDVLAEMRKSPGRPPLQDATIKIIVFVLLLARSSR